MGTKGVEGRVRQNPPYTTTFFLEADNDTYSTSGLHVSPSNAIRGEQVLKGNAETGGNTTQHLIFWHHQQEHRPSIGAKGEHSPSHVSSQQQAPISSKKSEEEEGTARSNHKTIGKFLVGRLVMSLQNDTFKKEDVKTLLSHGW
jgi:hypothetical protein